MTNGTIKQKIRKLLDECGAPLVEINYMRGIKKRNDNTVEVTNLFVSMGACDGDEFEAIKRMRNMIEEQGISIVNVKIDL